MGGEGQQRRLSAILAADVAGYTRLVEQDIPCLYNGQLQPAPEVAARGFKILITGGGHALSYAAVRQALLDLKQGGGIGEPRDTERFNATTSLLRLPEIYELEKRYATENA